MSDLSHRALRVNRVIGGPDWPLIAEILGHVVKGFEDAALNNTSAEDDMRLLHIAQAARLVARKFENALANEAGAEAE